MRAAAFLLVLAVVSVGAYLLLRTPAADSAGVSLGAGATAVTESERAPVDLVRGDRSPAVRSPAAPDATLAANAPPRGAAQPRPDARPKVDEKSANAAPPHGIESQTTVAAGADDASLVQKYAGSTPEQRRQAVQSIQQLVEFTPNLDPKEVVVLKHEVEWLESHMDG